MGIDMWHCRALLLLLLAAIVAVSGCLEFGAIPDAPPATPTPAPTSSDPTSYHVQNAREPSTLVNITLTNVDYTRTPDMKQVENITLTFKNTAPTNVTDVGYSIVVKNTPTGEVLYRGMLPVANLTVGSKTVSVASVPAHAFVYSMTVTVTGYWTDSSGWQYINDDTKPWYISLATNPYW